MNEHFARGWLILVKRGRQLTRDDEVQMVMLVELRGLRMLRMIFDILYESLEGLEE